MELKQLIKNYYSKITGIYFSNKILASEEEYLNIADNAQKIKYPLIDNRLKDLVEIDVNWLNNLALYTQVVKKKSTINYQHGRLLYSFLSTFFKNSNNLIILETGTARGFSSVVISKALTDLNIENFEIHTIDVIPHNLKIYWNTIDDIRLGKRTREKLLNNYSNLLDKIKFHSGTSKKCLKNLNKLKRINFCFLDGAHDYNSVKHEFNWIKQRQLKGDIILFDDCTANIFNGILSLVTEISDSQDYSVEFIKSTEYRGYALLIKN